MLHSLFVNRLEIVDIWLLIHRVGWLFIIVKRILFRHYLLVGAFEQVLVAALGSHAPLAVVRGTGNVHGAVGVVGLGVLPRHGLMLHVLRLLQVTVLGH